MKANNDDSRSAVLLVAGLLFFMVVGIGFAMVWKMAEPILFNPDEMSGIGAERVGESPGLAACRDQAQTRIDYERC